MQKGEFITLGFTDKSRDVRIQGPLSILETTLIPRPQFGKGAEGPETVPGNIHQEKAATILSFEPWVFESDREFSNYGLTVQEHLGSLSIRITDDRSKNNIRHG
ncbi:MAG TPA: hypothetical protein VLG27_00160 [Candidatus Saccharimonadia bacterium]|nr:hypothetical protein [Candidatus Saccharimonadia bacterium]